MPKLRSLEEIYVSLRDGAKNCILSQRYFLDMLKHVREKKANTVYEERLISLSVFSKPKLISIWSLLQDQDQLLEALKALGLEPDKFMLGLLLYVTDIAGFSSSLIYSACDDFIYGEYEPEDLFSIYVTTISNKLAVFYD